MDKELLEKGLKECTELFACDNLNNIHNKYKSIKINKPDNTVDFEYDKRDDIFPETFVFKSQNYDLGELWDNSDLQGAVILKNGKIIHEQYENGNTGEDYHIEWSATKSIGSIIFGAVNDMGVIPDLSTNVADVIPELRGSGYDGVAIQHVLDMASGIKYAETYDNTDSEAIHHTINILHGDVDKYSTTLKNELPPGSYNRYASIDAHIVAWIFRKCSGKTYIELLQQLLWNKIGAESDFYMLVDQSGNGEASGGACMRLRDLARIGQMVACGGVGMTGERVVSQKWIQQSVTTDTPQSQAGINEFSEKEMGYKNQWWIPVGRNDNEFVAIGLHGQFLYINQPKNIVIAVNCAYKKYSEDKDWLQKFTSTFQAISQHIG